MAVENRGDWRPENDPGFAQMLLRYLIRRGRWIMLGGFVLGGVIAVFFSLLMKPLYSSSATILVDKGTASSSLLSRVPLLGGGTSAALENEIQIIRSREIALDVIDELGLQVEVFDPHRPDTTMNKIKRLLRLSKPSEFTREEQFSRFKALNVDVHPDVLKSVELSITGMAGGDWRASDGASGSAGQEFRSKRIAFTPDFGTAHQGDYQYHLTVLPDWKVLSDFQQQLYAAPAGENTSVLVVSFIYHNPVVCKQVVDLVVEKYFENYQQSTLGNFDTILEYVDGEIADKEERLNAAIADLEVFREEQQVYEPTEQSRSDDRLVQDRSELTSVISFLVPRLPTLSLKSDTFTC